jgi:hypothetical protein
VVLTASKIVLVQVLENDLARYIIGIGRGGVICAFCAILTHHVC